MAAIIYAALTNKKDNSTFPSSIKAHHICLQYPIIQRKGTTASTAASGAAICLTREPLADRMQRRQLDALVHGGVLGVYQPHFNRQLRAQHTWMRRQRTERARMIRIIGLRWPQG